MERLQRFLNRPLLADRLDPEALARAGFRGRWLPAEIQPFDEVELARPFTDTEELLLTVAVEKGAVARLMLAAAPAGDDDADPRVLSPLELARALTDHGAALTGLLARITG